MTHEELEAEIRALQQTVIMQTAKINLLDGMLLGFERRIENLEAAGNICRALEDLTMQIQNLNDNLVKSGMVG